MTLEAHLGSGALSGKMLLVRIVVINKIYTYFRAGKVKLWLALSSRVRKGIRVGPRRIRAPCLSTFRIGLSWLPH